MISIIRVRGKNKLSKEINKTLDMLRLYNNNYCVMISPTPVIKGMLQKVKDYVTWGEIDEKTMSELIEKRGEEFKGAESDKKGNINYKRFIEIKGKKLKPFFRLNPPKKGYGRKGIKVPFKLGGALGDRKEKINDLIRRML
ncbi:50S ribosomal protein L30 [Candidatus Woesearchaeota archaeon]|nr:50S ribosomal protein L30 [Candidatus Woesearchaeota archaeon]